MKISREWLQSLFDAQLPNAEALAEALTFHAFEIDGIEKAGNDEVLDVKVTPNRGHDCLCHRGIAKELSAILKLESKAFSPDLLTRVLEPKLGTLEEESFEKAVAPVKVSIDTPLCSRYMAAYITGVKVGPSPDWLKNRLEAVGQRSINNIVDATNYVMFEIGQPLHAFDAGKLEQKNGTYAISVRVANAGEKMLALDEKEYTLSNSNLVIADQNSGVAVGIAGVKGGKPSGIDDSTTAIILESANFDGPTTRKTAQSLKLRTDASTHFEQVISPELAAGGMHAAIELIQKIAGGEVVGVTDVYPKPQEKWQVSVAVTKVKQILGDTFGEEQIKDSFDRLGFSYTEDAGMFAVTPPFERLDIQIAEDLVEEIGRIQGYDKIPAIELPNPETHASVNPNFYASEKMREALAEEGYSEVFTSVFADQGERMVLNKVDGVRPYLRDSLVPGLTEALKKNIPNKDLLGLKEIKLFEIGAVWKSGKEVFMVGTVSEKQPASEKPLEPIDAAEYDTDLPLSTTDKYQIFSRFPYIVRDVAFWVAGVAGDAKRSEVEKMIKDTAGDLCVKISLFDQFQKADKTSLAFRLIFQSFDRTLTDEEVNNVMEKIYAKLREKGFEIR